MIDLSGKVIAVMTVTILVLGFKLRMSNNVIRIKNNRISELTGPSRNKYVSCLYKLSDSMNKLEACEETKDSYLTMIQFKGK